MRCHKLIIPALGLAIAATLTACASSSSSSSSAATSSPSAPATSAPAASVPAAPAPSASGSAAAVAEIKKNWETFFSSKTNTATRVTLLQDGQKYESLIQSLSSSPLAADASTAVQSVTVTSATQAKVTYSLLA